MGAGKPKSLLEIVGLTIIQIQLDQIMRLAPEAPVFLVSGNQSTRLNREAQRHHSRIQFVVNHEWETTGTAHSLSLAAGIAGHERVMCLDGDVLVTDGSFEEIYHADSDCIGIARTFSDRPSSVELDPDRWCARIGTDFDSNYEFIGPSNFDRSLILRLGRKNISDGLAPFLPKRTIEVDGVEFDTPNDFLAATSWAESKQIFSSGATL